MNHQLATTSELKAVHEELGALAERRRSGEALRELAEAKARMTATSLRLVVLGEYKRGKSTLVNALLGASVLPMDIVPLTSVITEVGYAPAPRSTVEFMDGRQTAIPLDALPSFVTELGNPRNEKGVKRVIVQLPAAFLREGVTIVDTPGVGSVFEHNTEMTYEFLAESDAVVIVLAADQPLSAEERRLLAALAGITDQVLFAVNRTDVLPIEDVSRSVQFIRRTLSELDGSPVDHVLPMSAKLALDAIGAGVARPADWKAFESTLRRILVGRKSDVLRTRATTLTRRAADLLALELASEAHALGRERRELLNTIERLQAAASTAAGHLERSAILLRHDVRTLHDVTLRRELEAVGGRLEAELWPRVQSALRADGGRPLPRVVEELAAAIGEWVVGALRRGHSRTEAIVQSGLAEALDTHMTRVVAATGDVIALANELLGMRAEVPRAVAPLDERARFYLRDWDYAGGPLRVSRWVFRLPRRWAEPRARGALRELLERRVGQNLEAIRYDWGSRLDDAVRRFSKSSAQQLDAIVRLLTEGLKRAEGIRAEGAADRRREELARDLSAVRELRARLGEPSEGLARSPWVVR